ncbi:hypothetical protein Bca101_085014 [Brassica carinata]
MSPEEEEIYNKLRAADIFDHDLHENKMVIGVLGAVEPLRARARQDAALALYHLSLIPSNMTRLVRAGAVATLLSMVRSGESTSRILLVFCNLEACPDGKGAMLDRNAWRFLWEA